MDRDEEHRLQERITHVSRLATVGEMAAGVAHELNQPLTAIATYAQACTRLLDRPMPPLADVNSALKAIAAEAVRAGEIIRRLRQLARTRETERVPTDINALVGELRELMLSDTRAHEVRLTFELAPGLPPVAVDAVQIQHVLLNLMRNALEALAEIAPAGRELIVRTALTAEGDVEISMSDTARGVATGVAERMFDPFFTTKATGTGLGLSSSQTIVREHGGKLGFRPHLPAGACFYIHLTPIHQD